MAENQSSPDVDEEFKAQLGRRIVSYTEQEDRLQMQIRELQDELQAVQRRRKSAQDLFAAEFGPMLGEMVATVAVDQGPMPEDQPSGPYSGLAWIDAIMRVLEEEGGPLHVREIWKRLAANGFRTEAVDPVRSVVAIAVREPSITKVRPNTYALNGSYIINQPPAAGGDNPSE